MANESDAPNRTEVMAFQVHQDRSVAPPLVQGAEVNQAVGGVLVVQFYIDYPEARSLALYRTEDGEIESEYESVRHIRHVATTLAMEPDAALAIGHQLVGYATEARESRKKFQAQLEKAMEQQEEVGAQDE